MAEEVKNNQEMTKEQNAKSMQKKQIEISDLPIVNTENEIAFEEVVPVTRLKVIRERSKNGAVTYTGMPIYNYFIKGKIRGHEMVAKLSSVDTSGKSKGYELFDIVYDGKPGERDLYIFKSTMGVGRDKNEIVRYEVRDIDPITNMVYKAPIKPCDKSEAAVLEQFIQLQSLQK